MSLGRTALVIGGSRGLGLELVRLLHQQPNYQVYTTVRSSPKPDQFPKGVKVISGVDLATKGASAELLDKPLKDVKLDLVIYSAGVFHKDTLDSLDWDDMVEMTTTCAIAPSFIASKLDKIGAFAKEAKFLLITTEGGSIALRTPEEGGGNFGHHASKAAGNMVGKLLALDLGPKGITVVNLHPGFMRTSMTERVFGKEAWDQGGAVEPSVAAASLLDFAEKITKEHNGQFWAPRGPADVGEAERVMGKNLPTPLQLPW